jgi:hypothetical protein
MNMAIMARVESISVADPAYQAYQILHIGFTVAPILFGLDKFFNLMVDWEKYLAPWLVRIIGNAHTFMLGVGIVEIVAGLLVAFKPRWGAYIVALWLLGIIFNLLTYSGFYDIALRDFGLLLAALALGRLSVRYSTVQNHVCFSIQLGNGLKKSLRISGGGGSSREHSIR